jgi:hypothetical protein
MVRVIVTMPAEVDRPADADDGSGSPNPLELSLCPKTYDAEVWSAFSVHIGA